MKILFDQATPVPIRQYLPGHLVRTAAQQGWDKLRNGDLLKAAEEAGFDLLLTTDRNMAYPQNLQDRKIAITADPQYGSGPVAYPIWTFTENAILNPK